MRKWSRRLSTLRWCSEGQRPDGDNWRFVGFSQNLLDATEKRYQMKITDYWDSIRWNKSGCKWRSVLREVFLAGPAKELDGLASRRKTPLCLLSHLPCGRIANSSRRHKVTHVGRHTKAYKKNQKNHNKLKKIHIRNNDRRLDSFTHNQPFKFLSTIVWMCKVQRTFHFFMNIPDHKSIFGGSLLQVGAKLDKNPRWQHSAKSPHEHNTTRLRPYDRRRSCSQQKIKTLSSFTAVSVLTHSIAQNRNVHCWPDIFFISPPKSILAFILKPFSKKQTKAALFPAGCTLTLSYILKPDCIITCPL